MTGMGRAGGMIKKPPIKFDVEIKSYNHRFLEISIKCPNILLPYEEALRKILQKRLIRGHIVCVIQQDRDVTECNVEIDKVLLHAYLNVVKELQRTHSISGTIDINTLLSIQGLIKFSQPTVNSRTVLKEFKPILERAIDALIAMKEHEGKNIEREIQKSVRIIERNIIRVEKLIPQRNSDYKNRLHDLVKRFKEELNEERLYQELLYTVDRTDVTEECKRLFSHLELFKDALMSDAHPGRKLNFLLQEMQREANTCTVKANFLKISKTVVQVKEEIEKIREQVQNLE
jgi:uncharacterized protein (TIGR00255 family)